jgi:hypothetical protein
MKVMLMTTLRRMPKLLWLVVAAVVAGGTVVGVAAQATSSPNLPPVTAAQLIASLAKGVSSQTTVSGEVRVHLDLGLPQLPLDELGKSVSAITSLLGDHHLRVWRSPDGIRVADLLLGAERDLYVSRTNAWAWDSASSTAYHLASSPTPLPPFVAPSPPTGAPDPTQATKWTLHAIGPTTSVTVGRTASVAGRDVYVLRIEPRTADTLIGRVEIAVDAERRIPLRVDVFARGASKPAVDIGYTTVGFDPIDPSLFAFVPPKGAKVVDLAKPAGWTSYQPLTPGSAPEAQLRAAVSKSMFKTFGTGWTTVAAIRTPSLSALMAPSGKNGGIDLRQFLPFSGTLFSVRLVDRGDHQWWLVGAVPQATLAALEPQLP